ncbi:MAG TPA: TauD/TfdA family dioxygenase [Acidimicrobiales bacterium]|jgi:taurine dioxygenase|nr:TauD/TfdA family dioxygenase [Acidimicrobiales bacterium]
MTGHGDIEVVPLTPTIGAEVRGVDLREPVADAMKAIEEALYEHLVLFFRDQDITPEQQIAFARWFGPIEHHGYATAHPDHPDLVVLDVTNPSGLGTDQWHSDSSGKPEPAMGAVLRAVQVPDIGGDTCWSNMYAAYDALSEPMRRMLDGMTALHEFAKPLEQAINAGYQSPVTLEQIRSQYPPIEHPVVRTHPATGRKCLYVNHNYTTRICQLGAEESNVLLPFLVDHVQRPDFQVRFSWRPGSVALWDNRCTQHYALADYGGHRRVMHRVSIAGDRPF